MCLCPSVCLYMHMKILCVVCVGGNLSVIGPHKLTGSGTIRGCGLVGGSVSLSGQT